MEVISVLDASAMIAFAQREPGGDIVESLLIDPSTTCVAHAMNLCEVYYAIVRRDDRPAAEMVVAGFKQLGLSERNDLDGAFRRRVAEIKAGGRISLPDCFCLALAEKLGGQVVTSDHAEFGRLGGRVSCPILFFR